MGEEFEVGDVVKLKSGGLPMTVTYIGQAAIECCFYTDGRFSRQRLPREVLVVVLEDASAAKAEG